MLRFFTETVEEEKVGTEKKTTFTVFIFITSHIICSVSLIEVLKLQTRYNFAENWTALLFEKDFVLWLLINRS